MSMQYCFSGDHLAESAVTGDAMAGMRYREWVIGGVDVNRDQSAYSLLMDYIHRREGCISEDLCTRLRNQYPDVAERVAQSYYEWVHDL